MQTIKYPSTTAGHSYSYHIPKKTDRSNSTQAYSLYITESEYGACKDGYIQPPKPMSIKPACFYNMKPHSMPKVLSTNSKNIPTYESNYAYLNQPYYTCCGLQNSPANCF